MTACVNKKSKRVAAVVTASLVGALSIGAPAVALAANVNLQSVQPAKAVVSADNGQGDEVKIEEGKTVKLDADKGFYLRPTAIADSEGNDLDLDDYSVTYLDQDKNALKETGTGKPVTSENAAAWFGSTSDWGKDRDSAGKSYYVKVSKGSEDILTVKFTYVATTLDGVYAYESNAKDPSDTSDTTFAFNGTALEIKFAKKDGTALTTSEVKYYNADSSYAGTSVTYPGTYTAKVVVDANTTLNIPVTVSKFDLSSASVTAADTNDNSKVDTRAELLNYLTISAFKGTKSDAFKVTEVKAPNGAVNLGAGKGLYTVTIAANDDKDNKKDFTGCIEGTATFSYYVLDTDFSATANFLYGAGNLDGKAISIPDGESFDASKIKVTYGDETFKGDKLEVTFTKDGKKVDASALSNPGTYKVFVRVKAYQDGDDKWVGGSKECTVTVSATQINANKGLTFTLDGKVVADNGSNPGVKVAYTGEDLLPLISTKVVDDDDKVYEAGKDYKVKVVNANTGKEVEKISEVGTYNVVVEPVTFEKPKGSDDADWKLTVVVDEANFGGLKDNAEVAYTGSAISVPSVSYATLKDNNVNTPVKDEDGNVVYATLDSKLYKVASIKYSKEGSDFKTAKEIKAKGYYQVTIKLTDDAEKNYQLSDKTFTFKVRDFGYFTDVDSAEWYSVPVEQAWKQMYINGISGTKLFAPKADITRADAICILFNMAGGDQKIKDDEFSYSENSGYVTGFDDVDGKQYFGKALAWAKASGVANGSNGKFRPYDKITREEFVSLLANFAKSKGDYEAVDADSVLGTATDYSSWAKQNVAWAKANGIMGNNGAALDGTGNITRAQVAAMAVNYQPENLTGETRA